MDYRVSLLDALGILDLYAQWTTCVFCLMLSVYWILCPVDYRVFLFDALGILDIYAQWTTVFFA